MDATNLADIYGTPLLEWANIDDRLGQGLTQAPGTGGPNRHTCWLATINADGSPHVTGIGALWVDGSFWFETGADDPKGSQPRARPALHVERRDRRVRRRGRGSRAADHRSRHRRGDGRTLGREGWPVAVDESGRRSPPSSARRRPDVRPGSCTASRRSPPTAIAHRRARRRDPLALHGVTVVSVCGGCGTRGSVLVDVALAVVHPTQSRGCRASRSRIADPPPSSTGTADHETDGQGCDRDDEADVTRETRKSYLASPMNQSAMGRSFPHSDSGSATGVSTSTPAASRRPGCPN